MLMPLYLLDFGMNFIFNNSSFTLCNIADNGMYEARDKFGLVVEFSPSLAVVVN